MSDETITIEFSVEDAKARHIEHLQDVITRRNERIAELEAQLEPGAMDSEHYRRGFRDGWIRQYHAASSAVDRAITELRTLRADIFNKYLDEEGTNFAIPD